MDPGRTEDIGRPDQEPGTKNQGPYSYLSDWIGSRRAACFAGYHPKKMPTAGATPTDRITAGGEIVVDQCRYRERARAAASPTMTPARPPATLKVTASSTNCERTSRARPPTA